MASLTLEEWLEDLCVRFLNQPKEELRTVERICFHIQEASWFYVDHVRRQDPQNLPYLNLREFCLAICARWPMLSGFSTQLHELAFKEFCEYKTRVPLRGAILLDPDLDRVVLVQDMKSKTWSFPRGKIDQGESNLDGAIREVREETGFDMNGVGPVEHTLDYLEVTMKEQSIRLYLFPRVPPNASFSPHTSYEISGVRWFDIADLPDTPSELASERFCRVAPFVKALREWIEVRKGE